MRYLSLFSGAEAASLAWRPLGWECAGVAEVDPFCCELLRQRFPGVPNLGDVAAPDFVERAKALGRIDLVVGGSPCQAFSVAGLGKSLSDSRGNLTLRFVEVVRELRPEWIVWENVPGIFSRRDNPFGCFLGRLVGTDAALVPPRGSRWSNAGLVAGPARTAAWRVLDAQWFGVAQRRRRVFVVSGRAGDFRAGEILLEPPRLRGNPPARRASRQSVAADVAPSLGASGRGTVRAGESRGQDPVIACYGGNDTRGELRVATACNAKGGTGRIDFESETFVVAVDLQNIRLRTDGKSGTIRGEAQSRGSSGEAVCEPCGVTGDGLAPSLRATHDGSPPEGGMQIVAFHAKQDPISGAVTSCLGHDGSIAVALRGRDGGATAELGGERSFALRSSAGGGDKAMVLEDMRVRRLTPRECERLQGMPDDWTFVTTRGKPAKDGPRYKAVGNGMAVPVMAWIGRRIERAVKA